MKLVVCRQADETATTMYGRAANLATQRRLMGRQGFEPWTLGLRVPCSTS